MNAPARQRGVTLLVAIVATSIVGGVLSLLAISSAHYFRDRKIDQVRSLTRAVADSAAAYARLHLTEWRDTPPPEPITLDVQTLLPLKATGRAKLSFVSVDNRYVCRVSVRVQMPVFGAADEIDIEMNGENQIP